MGIFSNFIDSCADGLLIKLSKYREFPEEQYAVAIENRQLKAELATIKSSRYDELLEENKRIRDELDTMRKDRIAQLETEVSVLKIEMASSNSSQLLIGTAEDDSIEPSTIDKFLYIGGVFKYRDHDEKMRVKKLTEREFEDIIIKIFPDATITFSHERIHIQVSDYDGSRIDHKIISYNHFVNVESIDDWIEKNMKLRKHSKIDRIGATEGSWKAWE